MNRSSTTAAFRIGWRSIRRSRGRSALVVLLVLLPVAAMAAAITLLATVSPTGEARATHHMGTADAHLYANDGEATTDALRDWLPRDAQIEVTGWGLEQLIVPGREVPVDFRSLDLDGMAHGMLAITSGRQPERAGEVAVSASVANLAGAGLGGRIELKDHGQFDVVGLVEDARDISGTLVLHHISVAGAMADGESELSGDVDWLVTLPSGGDPIEGGPTACGTDECTFWGVSRAEASVRSEDATMAILVLGALALIEAVLVASAAFAVSVRRRQRELGLMSAVGAERRHLAATVLSEGVLLGVLGAVGGLLAGSLAILAASPWLDGLTNQRNPPVTIDATSLMLAGGIGLLACVLAAAAPAWSAARLPVLEALSGRRPPQSPAHRILALGATLIVIGTILTSAGTAMRLNDPGGSLSMILMAGGAILGVLGFGACSPWLIERLERFGLRLPVAARLALRDTARARSRNSPIVTAILAAFAATVALATYFASSDAATAATWQPWARPDQIIIHGDGAAAAGADVSRELEAIAAAPVPWLATADGIEAYASIEDPHAPEGEREVAYAATVGDAELLRALGAEVAIGDLENGSVVLITERPVSLRRVTAVVRSGETGRPVSTVELPVHVVANGFALGQIADAVVSQATADRLGVTAGVTGRYVIRLARPVVEADLARAAAAAADYPNTWAEASLGPTNAGGPFRLALTIASLLFALSVTGFAVALGEVESRPDQRTLLAIGADPGIRRRIAAARAGVLAVLAGVLAVPAGLIPAWGLLGNRQAPLVMPIPEVLAAVVILPLAGVLGALLLSRRIPAWSALREANS